MRLELDLALEKAIEAAKINAVAGNHHRGARCIFSKINMGNIKFTVVRNFRAITASSRKASGGGNSREDRNDQPTNHTTLLPPNCSP